MWWWWCEMRMLARAAVCIHESSSNAGLIARKNAPYKVLKQRCTGRVSRFYELSSFLCFLGFKSFSSTSQEVADAAGHGFSCQSNEVNQPPAILHSYVDRKRTVNDLESGNASHEEEEKKEVDVGLSLSCISTENGNKNLTTNNPHDKQQWKSNNGGLEADLRRVVNEEGKSGYSHFVYKSSFGGRKSVGKYATDVVNKILGILDQFGWCQQTLEELRTLELHLSPYQVAMVLNRQRDSDLALAFFQWAQNEANCQHDRFSYTTLIKVVARTRRLDTIDGILEEMKEVKCHMDSVTFTVAMRAFAQAGEIKKAMKLFSEMKDQGCEPDQVTYTVLIKMFADAKLSEEVLELYEEMLQNQNPPDTMTYNTLIHAFTRLGRHDMALNFFKEMRENGCYPSAYTYSILILLHTNTRRLDLCLETYKEMKKAGFKPSEVIVTTLVRAIKEVGNLEAAQELFADIQQAGLGKNEFVYSILIEMWAKSGDAISAKDCFDRMVEKGIKATLPLCNILIALYVKKDMFIEAKTLLASFRLLGLDYSLETITQVLHFLSVCSSEDEEITEILLDGSRGRETHTFLTALTSEVYKNEAIISLVQDFFDGLKSERRFVRHKFIDALINLLYRRDYYNQACCIWDVAVDFLFFDYVFEEPIEGTWVVNLMRMEEGTAVICLSKTFEYFKRQFGRREFSPKWVQIILGVCADSTNADSLKHKVKELLSIGASPFKVDSSGFVCDGETLLRWLNNSKVKSHFGVLSECNL